MRPSWEDLNAYVDGELAPEAAAEVAMAVARDQGIAVQVAALARLKVATGAALAGDSGDLPSLRLDPLPHPAPPRGRRWQAAAAALALAIGLGAGAWWLAPDPVQGWLAEAEARHEAWLATDPQPAAITEAAITRIEGPGGRIPDLEPARLAIAHVAAAKDRPGLYVGYVGVNGCRLGLWIGPAPQGLPAALTDHRNPDARGFTWRVDDTGYAVVAHGMDEARFQAVAAYLERLTRRTAGTHVAGLRDRADAPCVG